MNLETLRINRDSNGNSRMVVHFFAFITREEMERRGENWIPIEEKYRIALKRANALGGRKFHNNQFGGGIVFQASTEKRIADLVKIAIDKAEAEFKA